MISFIVPVYNCEAFLEECVETIVYVSMEKEIILIDDGSTDSSALMCHNLSNSIDYITFYEKEHGGAASARNLGLNKAKGEFIVFVDCDDTLDDKWYGCINKAVEKYADLIIYGMAFDYYDGKELVKTDYLSNRFFGIKTVTEIITHFEEFFINNTLSSACNKVFKKSIIDENQLFFDEGMNLYEDFDFVLQYLSFADTVCFVPECIYHYRHYSDEAHHKSRTKDLIDIRKNLDRLSESFRKLSDEKEFHSVLSNLYMSLLVSYLKDQINEAKKEFSKINSYVSNNLIVKEELTDNNKKVYDLITGQKINGLLLLISKWKLIQQMKRTLKKLLRK